MSDDMEYYTGIITLTDEEGVEHEFELVDETDIDNEHYVALIPVYDEAADSLEDPGELIILKAVYEGEDEFFEPIDNEKEFDRIAAVFVERLEEDYEFEE